MQKKGWMTASIAAMGAASLFSDLGHEMVTAVLPLFLTSIGASAAVLGLIEGTADAAASFIKFMPYSHIRQGLLVTVLAALNY